MIIFQTTCFLRFYYYFFLKFPHTSEVRSPKSEVNMGEITERVKSSIRIVFSSLLFSSL